MIRSRRGFTLVEMMLALALVGLVMVGLNTFIFSMTELWGRNLEPRRFDQQVRAVTRYLERELRAGALPPTAARPLQALAGCVCVCERASGVSSVVPVRGRI